MFLTHNDFAIQNDELVLKLPGYYFIFFTQRSCIYCHNLRPVFDRLSTITKGCNFAYVDVDNANQAIVNMSNSTTMPIEYVPLLTLYINGRCVDVFMPDEENPENNLKKMTDFLISHSKSGKSQASTTSQAQKPAIPPYSIGIPGNKGRDVCYLQPNKNKT